ncbi:MAG: hypothetical protein ACXAEN_18570 [Candidatus Thorarchaeota archaeon]
MKIDSIMVLCILFAPYTLFYDGSLLTIVGMTWVFLAIPTGVPELLLSLDFLGRNLFLLILPQVAFGYMMHRVYQAETSFRMAVFVGIIGILISTLESITDSIIMLLDPSWYFGWRTYPVPVIMLVAYLYMKRYPPPVREKVWPEE